MDELRTELAQLRAQRTAATDPAEKARLLGLIQDREQQLAEANLQDGRDALARVGKAAAGADAVAGAQPLDAVSALGRQGRKAASRVPRPKS